MYIHNDGGRAKAGYKGKTSDCVCRAFAIVSGKPYQEIADMITELSRKERVKEKSHYRTGVHHATIHKLAKSLGMKWTSTMKIGTGCKVHLVASELPKGRIVCSLSRHVVAVIDGMCHDIFDPARDGSRCVYGYWTKGE